MFTGNRPTDDMFGEGLNLHTFVRAALPEQVTQIADPTLLQEIFSGNAITNHNHRSSNMMINNIIFECLISIFRIGISCSVELPRERMNISDVVAQLCCVRNKLLGTPLHRQRNVRAPESTGNNAIFY